MNNPEMAIDFMNKYNFATLISNDKNGPSATHLPFLIDEIEGEIILTSHLAKVNPHGELLKSGRSLVVFSEPHAYISPSLYTKVQNVPTWNYIAVHAYGEIELIEEPKELIALMEKSIEAFEPDYFKQWGQLSEKYIYGLLKGVIGFRMKVSDLQTQAKLSQNKPVNDQEIIIGSLSKSDNTVINSIGEYMKNNFIKD